MRFVRPITPLKRRTSAALMRLEHPVHPCQCEHWEHSPSRHSWFEGELASESRANGESDQLLTEAIGDPLLRAEKFGGPYAKLEI